MNIKKILFNTNEIDVEKALPDAVVFCNKDGKIQWVNDKASEIFETSKINLLTSNIADFIENAQNLIKASVQQNSSVITKLMAKEAYYDMTSKEIKEGYVLDFRAANGSEKQLQNRADDNYKLVNRDKNIFLQKLTNDIKAPLQSIIGFSQAMADGLGGSMSEQQDKYIKIINKNSTELMYFVSKLIELSQTEAALKAPEYKILDVINLVNTLVKFNEQLYKEKNIRWNVTVEEDVKNTAVIDAEILKTIIQNLFEVTLRSIEMGDININISVPSEELVSSKNLMGDNFLMLSVSGSSLLLSENDLESIFDPYRIVDTSNKKNLLRSMTLACVKNLVESINGAVWVESEILKSTSFNIIIPSGKN